MHKAKHAYTRSVGSQSETPMIEMNDEEFWIIKGYQEYQIINNKITKEKLEHKIKFDAIKPYLAVLKNKKFIDIGCSSGYFGIQAIQYGVAHMTFVDHDNEYLELLSVVHEILNIKKSKIYCSKISDFREPHDVGFAFALIHWIYSYSDSFGSLEKIIDHLHTLASHTLFVEWIESTDYAIDLAGHIFQNPHRITQPYDKNLFIESLFRRYPTVIPIQKISDTREIYMATILGMDELLSLRKRYE